MIGKSTLDLVSILVFVELALGLFLLSKSERYFYEFQSLFSWNLPSDDKRERDSSSPPKFQSLFSWNLPSDLKAFQMCPGICWVSILVFVELALGLPVKCCQTGIRIRFNPCFRGTCPRTLDGFALTLADVLFQSLFSWNLPSDGSEFWKQMGALEFQSLFSWNLPSDYNRILGFI